VTDSERIRKRERERKGEKGSESDAWRKRNRERESERARERESERESERRERYVDETSRHVAGDPVAVQIRIRAVPATTVMGVELSWNTRSLLLDSLIMTST
jgi:hypothetical protein